MYTRASYKYRPIVNINLSDRCPCHAPVRRDTFPRPARGTTLLPHLFLPPLDRGYPLDRLDETRTSLRV